MKWTLEKIMEYAGEFDVEIPQPEILYEYLQEDLEGLAKKIRKKIRARGKSIKDFEPKDQFKGEKPLGKLKMRDWLDMLFRTKTDTQGMAILGGVSERIKTAYEKSSLVPIPWGSYGQGPLKNVAIEFLLVLQDDRVEQLYSKFGETSILHETKGVLEKLSRNESLTANEDKVLHYLADQTQYHVDRFYIYYSDKTMEKKDVSIYNKKEVMDSKGNEMSTLAKKADSEYRPVR